MATKEDRKYFEAVFAKLKRQRPDLIAIGEAMMKRANDDYIQLEKNGEGEAYSANWSKINELLGEIELTEQELKEVRGES